MIIPDLDVKDSVVEVVNNHKIKQKKITVAFFQ